MIVDDMIDCHCHILPSMDDGASSIAESIEMAKIAFADGIRKIVATPHVNGNRYSPEDISKRADELNRSLAEHGIQVQVYPAAELSMSIDPSLFSQYTINRTKYALVEFPHDHFPRFAAKLLTFLCNEGLKPIVAHPERNPGVIRNPASFIDLLKPGIYVQITAGSLTGDFGVDARICSELLLDSGKVDIIASDAHSKYDRPPILSKAIEAASKRIGFERASRMVTVNPEAVLGGGGY